MTLIEVQREMPVDEPTDEQIQQWVALGLRGKVAEMTVRLVERAEIQDLNLKYRGKDKPTNVLSFPYLQPDIVELQNDYLGDLVICPEIIEAESVLQEKKLLDHWAHIVLHGTLHLLGYDHISAKDAETMEALEIELLQSIDVPNPYETE